MSTYDERLSILERTIASLRSDFLQAIVENTHSMGTLNKVILQQEQNMRDADHEITILVGVISAQGRDIKDIKNRIDSFDQRFTSLEETFNQRFTSINQRFTSLEEAFNQRFTSSEEAFNQRFASVEGKLEQVLQILTTLPGTNK